ncbi:DNA repair protein RadC [Pleionea sp. CnH1-48]|uniref:RadC family protein n=1 Tax=Pleionea sp. CnH1-48 TaxID=2954494 RepID=UPI0020974377|nr:DNA repair protein RadC [Pleionea sp. CnH1-48]MCO7224448.1 DNA repair protein RadC [Pleionea sp. CnH1-48]
MKVKDWPQEERPREKLIKHGAESLSDTELLAIFLRTGISGKGVMELARELITSYGDVRELLRQPWNILAQHKGIGLSKYVQIQASMEMTRRCLEQKLKRGDVLTSPSATRHFLFTKLRDYPNEQFACLFLDNRHRVIKFEIMFGGSINQASVHPRVIVQQCLANNAAAVILAHNHPSGQPDPSHADIDITIKLKELLEVIDVRVLDHVIVGDHSTVSLAEQGVL